MARDEKCAHKACTCRADEHSDYCSPHCRATAEAEVAEIACECGHAGCGGEI